jgi:hypothetical protein
MSAAPEEEGVYTSYKARTFAFLSEALIRLFLFHDKHRKINEPRSAAGKHNPLDDIELDLPVALNQHFRSAFRVFAFRFLSEHPLEEAGDEVLVSILKLGETDNALPVREYRGSGNF